MLTAILTRAAAARGAVTSRSSHRCVSTAAWQSGTVGDVIAALRAGNATHLQPRAVDEGAPAVSAVKDMFSPNRGPHVFATTSAGKLSGIVAEKDYINKLTHGSFAPEDIAVKFVMHPTLSPITHDTSIVSAVELMLEQQRRHLPVLLRPVSEPLTLAHVDCVISMRDLVAALTASATQAGVVDSSRVDDLLVARKARGRCILLNTRLDDNITVAAAANEMARQNMNCVTIVDDAGVLVGVFTGKDFLTRVVIPGLDACKVRVRDLMTQGVREADPERSILRAAKTMIKHQLRHLPVCVDDRKVIGMVSLADVARALIAPPPAVTVDAAAPAAAAPKSA